MRLEMPAPLKLPGGNSEYSFSDYCHEYVWPAAEWRSSSELGRMLCKLRRMVENAGAGVSTLDFTGEEWAVFRKLALHVDAPLDPKVFKLLFPLLEPLLCA